MCQTITLQSSCRPHISVSWFVDIKVLNIDRKSNLTGNTYIFNSLFTLVAHSYENTYTSFCLHFLSCSLSLYLPRHYKADIGVLCVF